MEGWGYENIDLSLKAWMCGGGVVYVPCSQVLHYNARRNPMTHGNRKRPGHYLHNAGLIAKSYFSEKAFKDFNLWARFGKDLDDYRNDIRANKELLTRKICSRDYPWIRRHLMPDIESFDHETLIAHTLMVDGECVQVIREHFEGRERFAAKLMECGEPKPVRDSLRLTIWGELRIFDRFCLDWGYPGLHFHECHRKRGNQITIYGADDNHIKNSNGYCLVKFDNTNVLGKGFCQPKLNNYSVPSFKFGVVFKENGGII